MFFFKNANFLKLLFAALLSITVLACTNSSDFKADDFIEDKIHLSVLKSEYLDNPVRFQSKFQNKRIYAVGTIYEIKNSTKGDGKIWLKIMDFDAEKIAEDYSQSKNYVICSTKDNKFSARLDRQGFLYFAGIVSSYIEEEAAVLIEECELKATLNNLDVVENENNSNSSDLKLIFCGNTSGCAFSDGSTQKGSVSAYWIGWPLFTSVVRDEKEKIDIKLDCSKKHAELINNSESKLTKVDKRAENEFLQYIARKQHQNYSDVDNSENKSDSYIKQDYDRFVSLLCK